MATWLEISFLLRLLHFFNLLRTFVLSETRCSRNKNTSLNNNIFLTESSDKFYSPEYDTRRRYPANITCTWIISLQKQKIKLSFLAFDLQNASPTCQDGDYVLVRDGKHSDSPIIGTFCGSTIPHDIFSSGSYMRVHFRSDEYTEKRGFITSYVSHNTSNGLSATVICVALAVVIAILIAACIGASAMKKRKSRSPGRVRVYKTRPGITIKVSPATPRENRSEASLSDEAITANSLVLPKATSKFRVPSSWMKR